MGQFLSLLQKALTVDLKVMRPEQLQQVVNRGIWMVWYGQMEQVNQIL